MPLITTTPFNPRPTAGWELVTTNNAFPLSQDRGSQTYKLWLEPDTNTLLVANGSSENIRSREVAELDLTTLLWNQLNDSSSLTKVGGKGVRHPVSNKPVILCMTGERQQDTYTTGTDTWAAALLSSTTRDHWNGAACNLLNGDVLLVGSTENAAAGKLVDQWDGTPWSTEPTPKADIPTSPVDTRGFGSVFAADNNKVYLIGSRTDSSVGTDVVYRYDVALDSWSDEGIRMPEPHLQTIVVPLDGTRCMVIGGNEGAAIGYPLTGGSSKTYIFNSTTETFTPYGVEFGMPASVTPIETGFNDANGILLADGRVLTIGPAGTIYRTVYAP